MMKLNRIIFEKVHKQLSNISLGVFALLLLRSFPSYDDMYTNNMLGSLNTYSPFITAMAAVVSAIVTIFLVVVTCKYVSLTKELVNETIKAREYEAILKIKKYIQEKINELNGLSYSISRDKRLFQDLMIPEFDTEGLPSLIKYQHPDIETEIKTFGNKITELKSKEESLDKQLNKDIEMFQTDIGRFFSNQLSLNQDQINKIFGFIKVYIIKNTEELKSDTPQSMFWNTKRIEYSNKYREEIKDLDNSRKIANKAINKLIEKFSEILTEFWKEYKV